MSNSLPNREPNRETQLQAAPSDLHLKTQASPTGHDTINRTVESDLFATLRTGTAPVETLKLLIPGFELLEELGRGAFGVVYRARDEKLDRLVAIKVSLLDDPARREQYIKEARNAAKIDSPGIVSVYQVGTLTGGQPFVVQKLINGSTLRRVIEKERALDVRHACWLMSEIANVVAKAHALGMIHRDIKPDNILIDETGQPWVADFGLAILEEDQAEHAGERAGTPLYMSPEQLHGKVAWLDGRTDIYAMGVVLYEMLVGRTPFEARSLLELEQQVLHRDPKPISQRAPHVPPELDLIFRNCCAKRVEDRYANAYALVDDLQALIADLPETDSTAIPYLPEKIHSPAPSTKIGTRRNSARGSNRSSNRRKTLRQSTPLDETIELKPKATRPHRWFLIALPVVAACVAGIILWWPMRRTAVVVAPQKPPIEITVPTPIEAPASANIPSNSTVIPSNSTVQASQETQKPPRPEPPQRPFRVSKGRDGTHHTIAAALAGAEVGETITILPGTYLECLHIDRPVRLVGQGNRDDITIVGEDRSALIVDSQGATGSVIELVNLTLEGNHTGVEEFNTIDVQNGILKLAQCNVYSRSWDCVKLRPDSSLEAAECRFRSSSQPAIQAEQTGSLKVSDCSFDILSSTTQRPNIPVGIQASQCSGSIERCTFVGKGDATAIHWKESNDLLSVDELKVTDCKFGVIVQDCSQVRLGGSNRSEIAGCANGLLIERSTVQVANFDIVASRGEKGIRALGERTPTDLPTVTLENCSLKGFNIGLSVEAAYLSAGQLHCSHCLSAGIRVVSQGHLLLGNNSTILANEQRGIDVEDAIVNLSDCKVLESGSAGIYFDGSSSVSNISRSVFNKNAIGLLVVAGSLRLDHCDFSSNSLGLVIASHEIIQQTAVERAAPRLVDLTGGQFQGNTEDDVRVLAPCKVAMRGGADQLDSALPSPSLMGNLVGEQEGDVFTFSSKESKVAPNSTQPTIN